MQSAWERHWVTKPVQHSGRRAAGPRVRTAGGRLPIAGGRQGTRQAVRQWQPGPVAPRPGLAPHWQSVGLTFLPGASSPTSGPAGVQSPPGHPAAADGRPSWCAGTRALWPQAETPPGPPAPPAFQRLSVRRSSGRHRGLCRAVLPGASLCPLSPLRIAACTSSLSSPCGCSLLSWVRRPRGSSPAGAAAARGPGFRGVSTGACRVQGQDSPGS